jgi:L-aspartate semialdehyde sulfurtransferase ferredoxin
MMNMVNRKVVLKFPKAEIDQPIVSQLVKNYKLDLNIMRANIKQDDEGLMAVELKGDESDIKKGLDYLKKLGIGIQLLSKDIVVNWDKCTQCGACVAQCPVGALYVKDKKTMKIDFDSEKCIACELCVLPCPPRAIEVKF